MKFSVVSKLVIKCGETQILSDLAKNTQKPMAMTSKTQIYRKTPINPFLGAPQC